MVIWTILIAIIAIPLLAQAFAKNSKEQANSRSQAEAPEASARQAEPPVSEQPEVAI